MSEAGGLARLRRLEFPRRFPIVQFPNVPLAVGLLAGAGADLTDGAAHRYLMSISYLAVAIWAYGEMTAGVNWFRRLLGAFIAVGLIVRLARPIHS